MAALERVKLTEFVDRPAPYLSGGQQQRVALARALVSEPAVMLLDEPLSNLDAKLRDAMRVELRELVKSFGMTTIYVTHDQVEALSMSDRIALMNKGEVVQLGTPDEMYLRPKTTFVAEFIGRSNIIPGNVREVIKGREGIVEVAFGKIACALPEGVRQSDPVELIIRPHAIEFVRDPDRSKEGNIFEGRIMSASFLGEFLDIEIETRDTRLRVFGNPFEHFEPSQQIAFRVPSERCVVLGA
jgi:iron(III) transport system ATP-binding protein